jgi:lysozyme family protein
MAQFKLSFDRTMTHEGGYSNLLFDPGQETYRGISRRYHPSWSGWVKIDELKKTTILGPKTIIAELEPLVAGFYKVEFWDRVYGDMIPDQGVANILFDSSVLCSTAWAVGQWQDTLDHFFDTEIDGQFGAHTLDSTLKLCHSEFLSVALAHFKYEWADHLIEAIKKDQKKSIFALGWFKRIHDAQ